MLDCSRNNVSTFISPKKSSLHDGSIVAFGSAARKNDFVIAFCVDRFGNHMSAFIKHAPRFTTEAADCRSVAEDVFHHLRHGFDYLSSHWSRTGIIGINSLHEKRPLIRKQSHDHLGRTLACINNELGK